MEITPQMLEEHDSRILALAKHWNCEPEDITDCSWNDKEFEIGPRLCFLVVTDSEADELWDDYLESYIDECLEIPDNVIGYFDREAWKCDARIDGRAHSLARYDGDENEVEIDGEIYFIYRQ